MGIPTCEECGKSLNLNSEVYECPRCHCYLCEVCECPRHHTKGVK